MKEPLEVIRHPMISEKAVGMIEKENKLVFIVYKNATKTEIKEAVEKLYAVKVDKVNIINDRKGRKKAIVKINNAFKANDIAIKIGII